MQTPHSSSIRNLINFNWRIMVALFAFASMSSASAAAIADPNAPSTGILIQEDYEVTEMKGLEAKGWIYTYNPGRPPSMDIVSSPVHSGSGALRMTHREGNGKPSPTGNGVVLDDLNNAKIGRRYTPVEEAFTRYYVRYEAVDPSQPSLFVDQYNASAKQHYFNPGGADPISPCFGFAWSGNLASSPGFAVQRPFEAMGPRGKGVTSLYHLNKSSMDMPFNEWVCVETQQKFNTPGIADGILRVWLNDTLTLEYTDVTFRNEATASSRLRTLQIYRQGAINMYRYEDDFVMATHRIGPLKKD